MKNRIEAAFNQLAEIYEHSVDTASLFNTELERPAMLKCLPNNLNNMQVLDAGCAAGWYTNELVGRGAKVVATDLSPKMVEAAKRRVGSKVEVRCLDLSVDLPFTDNSFDIILSSLALHYLEDWRKTFAEFQRILKPSGFLLFSVHHPFMDIQLSQNGEYYLTELIIDQWNKNGQKVEVPFYRRPLQSVINDTLAYFTIEKITEPQPTTVFKRKSPEKYEKLMSNPHFLIVKAVNNK
ncbi:class I SAM-dependent methyltransferase [Bacillus niameyensis]|uniref:class I SAM-dependent methyltransferase n=1 Tax=Bacillus niameyensis TaxID=1522308 RepID=UPI000784F28B|nr:class I SAM-dependent methyltransferase [Bacillus niameyensis]